MSFINTVNTEDLYHKVARLIEDSRARIVTSINLAEVYTKFRIGQYIVEYWCPIKLFFRSYLFNSE